MNCRSENAVHRSHVLKYHWGAKSALLAFAVCVGCGATGPCGSISEPNYDPTADAGSDVYGEVGQRIQLNGWSSDDPDGDALSYNWQQRQGPSVDLENPYTVEMSFIPAEDGEYEFVLTVTDDHGNSDEDTVFVVINPAEENHAPMADAGYESRVEEGEMVRLDGSNSSDPDGDVLTFEWELASGPRVSMDGSFAARMTFQAPDVDGEQELEFVLTVSDEEGLSDSATVIVTVFGEPGPPRCRPGGCPEGQDCNNSTGKCEAIRVCDDAVDCDDRNPCTEDYCYSGKCTATNLECDDGLACTDDSCNHNTGQCIFTSNCPAGHYCDNSTDLCTVFECTSNVDCDDEAYCNGVETCVSNLCLDGTPIDCPEHMACDEATKTCTPDGAAPTANAGDDKTVDEGASVSLSGSGTDPEYGQLTYDWTQVSGPNVVLTGTDAYRFFAAPSVTANSVLVFRLTVTDPSGLSGSDEVSITVEDGGDNFAKIALSRKSLTPAFQIGQTPPDQSFSVRNSGAGTLYWTITVATESGGDWLSVNPASGTSTGATSNINAKFDPAGLTEGVYRGTITVSDPASENKQEAVSVTLTVLGTTIHRSTIAMNSYAWTISGSGSHGSVPDDASFEVWNSGNDELHFSVMADVTWIQFEPKEGITGAQHVTIKAKFLGAEQLPVGEHSATISVSAIDSEGNDATNSPQTIPVTLVHPRSFAATILDSNQVVRGPNKLAVDADENLYVTCETTHRVHKFFADDRLLMSIGGTQGSAEGQFNMPAGIAIDSQGNIYVSELGNDRIQKFAPDGRFLLKWGIFGSGIRQFSDPSDIAIDSADNVYVADTYNRRIQKFGPDGSFILKWDTTQYPSGLFIDDADAVFVANGNEINEHAADGTLIRRLIYNHDGASISDVAMDADSELLTVDSYGSRINRWMRTTGSYLNGWSRAGSGPGQHGGNGATGIALGANDVLYSADKSNNRILKWEP